MNIIEEQPTSLTSQAVSALQAYEPQIDMILSYADLTVAADGISKVEEAHKAVKRLRVDLEKKRKELNSDALEYQRTVNSTAKKLTEKISAVEGRLESERENYEAEKLKEKQAKEAAKAAALNDRVAKLSHAGIAIISLTAVGAMTDEQFAEYFTTQSQIAAAAKAEAERLEAARQEELKRQAEELRIRAEEIERQRLADEAVMAEERARLKAQQDAEEARQAEERARLEVEQKEAKRIEAERRAAEMERLRIDREQMEAERAEMRRQQEELARHQAEVRAKAEAEERERIRVELEAEQARREAAAAPELEKLESVRKYLIQEAQETLKTYGNPAWSESLIDQIHAAFDFARGKIRESL